MAIPRSQLLKELLPGLNRLFGEIVNPLPRLTCGNFVERTDGAIYIRLDKTTAYYSHNKLIAVAHDGVLYRDGAETQGPIFKRVRRALQFQPIKKTKDTSTEELHAMVEVAIMAMASRLIDEKLGITTR